MYATVLSGTMTSTLPGSGFQADENKPSHVLDRDLASLAMMLSRLTDAEYRQTPVGVFESSVGGHIRHCLDHVAALLDAIETGELNYDQRRRGTAVETDRNTAISSISALRQRLRMVAHVPLYQQLRFTALLTKGGAPVDAGTTVGRELAFVVSHTTHHNAIVAAMTKIMNVETPDEFGLAPATAAYRDAERCVR